MAQMMFNLLIALVMIYIVMAAVFESLLFPAAIMSGVVFSVFGVFWLFWITGTEFNIMAFIGILVLMGVVVNNGIVMIEHINNLRRRGMCRTDALVEGSRERLRPILMTMGTAILAMVPISLSTGHGSDMPAYYPMARAIAGGLAFSTLVSLLFLPTIYAILDDLRHGTTRLMRRARDAPALQPRTAVAAPEGGRRWEERLQPRALPDVPANVHGSPTGAVGDDDSRLSRTTPPASLRRRSRRRSRCPCWSGRSSAAPAPHGCATSRAWSARRCAGP